MTIFDCNFYIKESGLTFKNRNQCYNHWLRIGKGKGIAGSHNMLLNQTYNNFISALNSIQDYECPCQKSLNHRKFNRLWYIIHKISYQYDKLNNEKLFRLVIDDLKKIKCKICNRHYWHFLKKHDINNVINSKANFILFFLNLHNEINESNNKKKYTLEECDKIYK